MTVTENAKEVKTTKKILKRNATKT